jgi:terminase, large subunit
VSSGTSRARDARGGEWRVEAEFRGHASFHLWAAYSLAPNETWAKVAAEFLNANDNPQKLKTFVNTVFGETWKEEGEAREWEPLYERRELYAIGSVPTGARVLTAGVDVQKDRFVYELTAWAETKESWSVEESVILGDTSDEATWAQLDELLARTFPARSGGTFRSPRWRSTPAATRSRSTTGAGAKYRHA